MTVPRLPPAGVILTALLDRTGREDGRQVDEELSVVMDPILALHRSNAVQWDREDDARRDTADDAKVAAAKRDIDRLNSARHRFIEAIDREILLTMDGCEGAPLVTESPGMAVDRLSVLVIRLVSTEARATSGATDARRYAGRLPRLRTQLSALEESIDTLLNDLAAGRRRFVAYESLKLYGTGGPGQVD